MNTNNSNTTSTRLPILVVALALIGLMSTHQLRKWLKPSQLVSRDTMLEFADRFAEDPERVAEIAGKVNVSIWDAIAGQRVAVNKILDALQ